jgi:cobyrinic acid a,c-diamide synthase
MYRFLISAAHKSSGKTTISIGLASALQNVVPSQATEDNSARQSERLSVQPFKKGPDYIDPLWLGMAAGRACHNLDFFLSTPDELKTEFSRYGGDADICLVEGNKGLYDGLDLKGSNSNAALAKLLDLPVILVLDARGMTRGIAPLILGYQAFDRDLKIAGVILNKLGGRRHESKLRAVIEHYTDIKVIGAIQDDPRLVLVERHLGLMPANEATNARQKIQIIAAAVRDQVDLERLLRLTATATPLPPAPPLQVCTDLPVRIAIARDAAFGFYYAADLDALRRAGAELCFFDSLHDPELPACDGLLIGGGFPESFLTELEANVSLRDNIRQSIADGLPTYAECGGLMYLSRRIRRDSQSAEMVGVIPGEIVMHPKPIGRGYVILKKTPSHPWPDIVPDLGDAPPHSDAVLHAHEFHYSSLEGLPADTTYAYTVRRGHGVDGQSDGIVQGNLLASYTHLRATAGCDWPQKFVNFIRQQRRTHPTQTSSSSKETT